MMVDLLMGVSAVLLALALTLSSTRLADLMLEGDGQYRERHPWVESYEPQVSWLETSRGRWWILRGWVLLAASGFGVIGGALVLRAAA